MHIAILNWRDTSNPRAGGSESHVHGQIYGLTQLGHTVDLFTSREHGASETATLGNARAFRNGGRFTVYFRTPSSVKRECRVRGYDIVLEHVNGVPWYSPLWTGVPSAAYLYHVVGRTFFEELPFPLSLLGFVSERTMHRFYSDTPMACLGEGARSDLTRIGFDRSHLTPIPPGIDTNTYRPGGSKSKNPSLLAVGPLKQYKHHDRLVRALPVILRRFPSMTLTIIGQDFGGLRNQLWLLAKELGVEPALRLMGRVDEGTKVRLMQESWCVAYASDREGWGLGVLEAAACGTASVVPSIRGMSDAVIEGETGLKYVAGDRSSLAETLSELFGNPDLRNRLQHNALIRAQSFTWLNHAKKLEDFLARSIS